MVGSTANTSFILAADACARGNVNHEIYGRYQGICNLHEIVDKSHYLA